MNLLLDTHTFLWLAAGDSQLSQQSIILLQDKSNELKLSMVSVWEMSIKSGLGKLKFSSTLQQFIETTIDFYGILVLPLSMSDCLIYERLGFPDKEHRDPFDRMIISQAINHDLHILGIDQSFDSYPIRRIW